MRLRQIALVGEDLTAAEADIRAVLGLDYAYDDPGVGAFGLRNAVFPVGETFLEVVSPKQEGTTAGRLLEKRGGDGGYMVIFQVRDIAEARERIAKAGARTVAQADRDGVHMTHIHPRDIGGAIVSVDQMEPWERWEWGGPVWRDNVRIDTSVGITGAELQGDDPAAMARRWGEILGRTPEPAEGGWRIGLEDGGEVRFVTAADGRGEGLGRFDVAVRDPAAVRAAAKARGLLQGDDVILSGTRVRLVQA
ncbi:VOC family protein [Phenylobacterium sp.]|jgi:catechol 2,3-dioxygenase-like lactoylglutathione lyase family enzyme|uniref:VOC family protein n=1 Tax=Phenylobacterium sp. TaxID=1871053 RepID=UPI002E3240DD|nr:VOC family protein [Phenylobacterium sp.]HEX4711912.1 VOC family protein [Phenylobacterium sp.]